MSKRTLRLRRETLAELTTEDLAGVVGAQGASGITCPVLECTAISGHTCLDCLTRSCV